MAPRWLAGLPSSLSPLPVHAAEVWPRCAAQGDGAACALPTHQHHCGWRHYAGGEWAATWPVSCLHHTCCSGAAGQQVPVALPSCNHAATASPPVVASPCASHPPLTSYLLSICPRATERGAGGRGGRQCAGSGHHRVCWQGTARGTLPSCCWVGAGRVRGCAVLWDATSSGLGQPAAHLQAACMLLCSGAKPTNIASPRPVLQVAVPGLVSLIAGARAAWPKAA